MWRSIQTDEDANRQDNAVYCAHHLYYVQNATCVYAVNTAYNVQMYMMYMLCDVHCGYYVQYGQYVYDVHGKIQCMC